MSQIKTQFECFAEAERLLALAGRKQAELDKNVARSDSYGREDLTQEVASATARAGVFAVLAGIVWIPERDDEDLQETR